MFSNDSKKQREYNIKITCEIIDIKFIVWYKLDFCFYQLLQHEQVHTSLQKMKLISNNYVMECIKNLSLKFLIIILH